jgi:hypothetical protein
MDAYTKLYIEHILGDLMRGLGAEVGRSERETHDLVLHVVENLTKTVEAQNGTVESMARRLKAVEQKLAKPKQKEAEAESRPASGQNLTVIGGRAS